MLVAHRRVDKVDQVNHDRINVMVPRRITAAEAAARLGVKRETLYAYVSRGVLARTKDDGRTSTFDAAEVDRLRRRALSGRRAQAGLDLQTPTRITRLSEEGVWYREHPVEVLVARRVSYERVAELLLTEELPDAASWELDRVAARAVQRACDALPADAPAIDRLRLATTVVSALDPLRKDLASTAVLRLGRHLVPALVSALPPLADAAGPGIAAQLWSRVTDADPASGLHLFEQLLVLLADHELATATVAVRVAASVRADPYSCVIAGLGAVAGTLHGAASIDAHDLLTAAITTGDPPAVVAELLRQGRRIPGFGHRVYREDPRARLLLEALGEEGPEPVLDAVAALVMLLRERNDVAPNIDLASAALAVAFGMGREAGEVIFAVARTAGWLAHALEEYGEAPLRFRATARYVG
jgi:citrate synthase